jgi:hypothetical protein
MSNIKLGCGGIILTLLLIPLIIFGGILLNGVYLQLIYNWGLTPLLAQFEIYLPTLSYGIFVFIWTIIAAIKTVIADKKEPAKEKHEITTKKDVLKVATKLFGEVFSSIMTKFMIIFIMWITYCIVFT